MDFSWFDLKDTIERFGNLERMGGMVLKLFFIQNNICRLGKKVGRKEGKDDSSRLAW